MAGPRSGTLRVETVERGNRATHTIEHGAGKRANLPPVIEHRIGERRDLGYIRLRLGDDEATGPPFERALSHLLEMRALIVDLRDTPASATRESTLEILRHFADRETAWQMRRPRHGPEATDRVAGAGVRYRGPVVVLVDRWTAGEAEALAAGLVAVCGARIVGTATAGLRGELREVRLAHSGIVARFPGEKTLLVNGQPRETLRPTLAVDLAAPKGGPGDPILYEALKLLEKN
jgi:C-terminal processing protease CtpA/Prc